MKPILKVLTYDFYHGMGIMACKMLKTTRMVLFIDYNGKPVTTCKFHNPLPPIAIRILTFKGKHITRIDHLFQSKIFFQASNFQ